MSKASELTAKIAGKLITEDQIECMGYLLEGVVEFYKIKKRINTKYGDSFIEELESLYISEYIDIRLQNDTEYEKAKKKCNLAIDEFVESNRKSIKSFKNNSRELENNPELKDYLDSLCSEFEEWNERKQKLKLTVASSVAESKVGRNANTAFNNLIYLLVEKFKYAGKKSFWKDIEVFLIYLQQRSQLLQDDLPNGNINKEYLKAAYYAEKKRR